MLKHNALMIEIVEEQIEFARKYINVVGENKHIVGTNVPETKIRLANLEELLAELKGQ